MPENKKLIQVTKNKYYRFKGLCSAILWLKSGRCGV